MIRWPGHIKPGLVSNEIVCGLDWFPTLVAAAGDTGIEDKLAKGMQIGSSSYKVHLDGYNILPYLEGKEEKSPHKEFFYFNDDGQLVAVRYESWKQVFCEQRAAGTLWIWAEPFTCLRLSKVFNLCMDPYERADITSNTYYDWLRLDGGSRVPRVAALRDRLLLTSDLDRASAPIDEVFDVALERGLQKFQERHGLDADGAVGTSTLTALNVPAEARVRQIELNMERLRWLPQTLGERYILVNSANFALDVVEHGRSVLAMRVVVGKPARRTPFFSADMTYLVLSPHWYVPPTMAIQDKLPLIRRDPGYVSRQHFKLFRHGEGGVTRVDPMSVDWSSVSARNFLYQLRQDPGPRNALGRVKFMLPNPYHVYLHDTPARELFAKTERAFSSGCIRLENPMALAEYLLTGDPQWSRQKLVTSSKRGTEQVVHLPTRIPVHLLYWTAWADENGVVHFRKDIYDRDKVLDKALLEFFPFPRREEKVVMVVKQ